jgi:hypothetical protein
MVSEKKNTLHKKISIKRHNQDSSLINFFVYGSLIGWTDGNKIIYHNDIGKIIKDECFKYGPEFMVKFMKGVVGPCVVEVSTKDETWFFSSCSSSGFYWALKPSEMLNTKNYLISNDEGRFLKESYQEGGKISEGSLMNVLLSHQSVIRPPFDGMISKTKRCPPGFYAKFTLEGVNLKSFLINEKKISRKQQDYLLEKKMDAMSKIYKSYCTNQNVIAKLAFSGGLDSTTLLINFKSCLDQFSQGYYRHRGKIGELKLAKDIAKRLSVKIDILDQEENFSISEIKSRAEKGLGMLNGIVYLKHGFRASPYNIDEKIKKIILNGQSSDTLFHIDTFAPPSSVAGIKRFFIIIKGISKRLKTTPIYYKILRLFKKIDDKKKILPSNVLQSLLSLSEHKNEKNTKLTDDINNIIKLYKNEKYVLPIYDWLKDEFKLKLANTELNNIDKDNQAARFTRWLRSIGNFQQNFHNISLHEKTIICTPFTEGPLSEELVSYKLSLLDIFMIKRFINNFINSKLGISYSNIRQQVLGKRLIDLPKKIFFFVKKFYNNDDFKKPKKNNINKNDISILRDILVNKNSTVDRILLKHVVNKDCKEYINYLYDCLDYKIDFNLIDQYTGTHLCRLVNLQVILLKK